MKSKKRKYFFGWSNIKWFIKEIVNIYSDEPSFFSKKRIESSIAFWAGQFGMIYYLLTHVEKMTSSDLALWAGIEFLIAGYKIYHIQQEKNKIRSIPPNNTPPSDGPQVLHD